MIQIIEEIADYKVKNYQLDKPKGVRGRSSDNSYVYKKVGWKPDFTLEKVLKKHIFGLNNRYLVDQILKNSVKVILKKN